MDGKGEEPGLGARLAIGGIAGLVATLALVSTVRRLGPRDDRPSANALAIIAPYAFGAACGALLAAAGSRPSRITGALAGGGFWLAGEVGLLPKVSIIPVRGQKVRHAAALLAGHLAWGWSAASAMREVASKP
jgi:hypothetical protein